MRLEKMETKKTPEAIFEATAKKIIERGYERMSREHDHGGRDPKIYHVSEHPRTLEGRAEKIASILGLSPKEHLLVRMGIAFHDLVIGYDTPDPDKLLGVIRRHRGARVGDIPKGLHGNEAKSAIALAQDMRKANTRAGQEIFSIEDIGNATWTIDATYPNIDLGADSSGAPFESYPYFEIAMKNQELKKFVEDSRSKGVIKGPHFFQPHLEQALEQGTPVPHEVLTVALSDLGGGGIDAKERFFKEGDDEMRELYVNLQSPKTWGSVMQQNAVGRANREKVTRALLLWLDRQVGFIVWQALRFEKIMHLSEKNGDITHDEAEKLRALFSNYVPNARATYERSQIMRKELEHITQDKNEYEAFLHLTRSMHFEPR